MSDSHEWCRDVRRDEAVRAAEDAAAVPAIQHRDLPEQVALVWASLGDLLGRVVRLEGEMDAGQDEEAAPAVCDSASPANGLRTERVTPPWQRAKWDEALAIICDGGDWGRGNNFDHGVLGALVIWADKKMDRLTAERDAAIRERDAAQSQCEELERAALVDHQTIGTLRARVAELERDRRPATWQEEEAAVEGAWLLCGLEPDWPSDEPGTIVRHAESMRREVGRLRDRVAELEAAAAPAANAGVEKQEPVAWAVTNEHKAAANAVVFMLQHMVSEDDEHPDRMTIGPHWISREHRDRALHGLRGLLEASRVSAPPPPRGWLTAEEREAVQWAADAAYDRQHPDEDTLRALLARNSPPKVRMPDDTCWVDFDVRYYRMMEVLAALAAAGVEVEE